MKKDMPNIFDYSDYRRYLKDFYHYKKGLSRDFSHRVFVRMCGFKSPNFLKLVMDGKRNLSRDGVAKIADYIRFNKSESEYFASLVAFTQAKGAEEKGRHFSDVAQLAHRAKSKIADVVQYDYLSKWYYVAIRELVSLDDFTEDAAWINRKLKTRLAAGSIRRIIDLLIGLKLLERDANGNLKQTDSNIVCSPEVFSVAVNNYHQEMMQKAIDSIVASRSRDRDISGLTISVDRDSLDAIKDAIKKCRREIHHISSKSSSKKVVCQVNFQVFNLSEAKWN